MFRELLPAGIGMLALIDRTAQPVTIPFDGVFLAAHSNWRDFGVLAPAVMAAGSSIFEGLFAIRTRKRHEGVKLYSQTSPSFKARPIQFHAAWISNTI